MLEQKSKLKKYIKKQKNQEAILLQKTIMEARDQNSGEFESNKVTI